MHASTTSNAVASDPDIGIRAQVLEVSGALRPYVRAFVAADIACAGPLPLAVAPHESLVLTVQIGRDAQCIEQKGEHGELTALTGIRRWTGSFHGAGECVTLFALLTPLGLVQLLEGRVMEDVPRIRARVAEVLDRQATRGLESLIATAPSLDARLRGFAGWLEARATRTRSVSRAALRAGRAAMRLCGEPQASVETLAGEQHVSRRQLERDFQRWLGTSPRHLAQVARLQQVARVGQAGGSLAQIAMDAGFADQAHMSRSVRELTGLTAQRFVRTGTSAPMAAAFRRATSGGRIYL